MRLWIFGKETPLTKLEEAKALITDKLNWCRFTYAVRENGDRVNALNPLARKFDASGACTKVGVTDEEYRFLIKAAKQVLIENSYKYMWYLNPPDYVQILNDDLWHKNVMEMFDVAIALEKEERKK